GAADPSARARPAGQRAATRARLALDLDLELLAHAELGDVARALALAAGDRAGAGARPAAQRAGAFAGAAGRDHFDAALRAAASAREASGAVAGTTGGRRAVLADMDLASDGQKKRRHGPQEHRSGFHGLSPYHAIPRPGTIPRSPYKYMPGSA